MLQAQGQAATRRPDASEDALGGRNCCYDDREGASYRTAVAAAADGDRSELLSGCSSSTTSDGESSAGGGARQSASFRSATSVYVLGAEAGCCDAAAAAFPRNGCGGDAADEAVADAALDCDVHDYSCDSDVGSLSVRYLQSQHDCDPFASSRLADGYGSDSAQSLTLYDGSGGHLLPPFPLMPSGHLPFPDGSGNIAHLSVHVASDIAVGSAAAASAAAAAAVGYAAATVAVPTVAVLPSSPSSPPQTYPSVYVSPGGLITVLLKYDIAVEMTLDKTLRVVNHRHKAVAATNARGSANCIFHVAAKIFQDGTRTEAEVFGERRCRMTTDGILFASGVECYLLDDDHIVPAVYCFSDMSKDCSVNILFASAAATAANCNVIGGGVGESGVVAQCEQAAKAARYYFHKNGSTTVILNNVKVHQDERGDVQVTSGPKYIFTSPVNGSLLLQSHFVDMSVQVNWCVSVRRGEHLLQASYTGFTVSNGKHEAGFDQYRSVFSRTFREVASEYNNWLPSLALLPQLLPNKPAATTVAIGGVGGNRETKNRSRFDRNRSHSRPSTAAATAAVPAAKAKDQVST